jgi:hypothetical protein
MNNNFHTHNEDNQNIKFTSPKKAYSKKISKEEGLLDID